MNSGTYNFDGGAIANGGTLRVNGGTANIAAAVTYSGSGEIVVSSGTARFAGIVNTAALTQSGGTLSGPGTVTAGTLNWTGGTMGESGHGGGTTNVTGVTTISASGNQSIYYGHTLNLNGTTSWTSGDSSYIALYSAGGAEGTSTLNIGAGASFTDAGAATDAGTRYLGYYSDGLVNNAGTYNRNGLGTTQLDKFGNTGTVNVNGGTLTITGGLTNFSGTTLTGGNFNVIGASTFSFIGANVVTNAAGITLDGAGSQFLNASGGTNGLANLAANTAAGSFTIRNGRNFTSVGPFDNAGIVNVGASSTFTGGGLFTNQVSGQLQMAGGSYAGPSLANSGVVSGFGAVAPVLSNSGTVRASGGTLELTGGVLGATGTVLVDTGATLSLGAASTARNLTHEGTLLALGTNNITVFNDYNNANFGVGNSFDRRAGVSGTGQILASGTTQQTLTGALITGGDTGSVVMTLPNIRVGLGGISSTFTINNVGLGGPSLRGALVTTGINNTGLSGSGVTAQNWGAISQFGPGQTFTVTFDPNFGQALSGQVLQVVNNFDNVAGQTLTITGQAFNLAQGAASPTPIDLGNFRVGLPGGAAPQNQNVAVANTVAGPFTESLGIGAASVNNTAFTLTNNLGTGLIAAGGSNAAALNVARNGGGAGLNTGTLSILYTSDGAGTSGLAAINANSENLSVNATGFNLAQGAASPAAINLGNFRVGVAGGAAPQNQNVAVANTVAGPFTESLGIGSASVSNAAFTLTNNLGSALILAGGSNASALNVARNSGIAGLNSGTLAIQYTSDGAGTSGLMAINANSQNITVNATGFNAAAGSATPTPINLGNFRVGLAGGATPQSQNVAVANIVAGTFTESLGIGSASVSNAAFTLTNNLGSALILAGGSNASALNVARNSGGAGLNSGTLAIQYTSDGTGTSGLAAINANSQNITVNATGYNAAVGSTTPSPVNLAAQRVGGTLSTELTVANTVAAGAFSEDLNASFSGFANGATGSGSIAGRLAGTSNTGVGSMSVGLDTTTSGVKSGTATLAYATAGAVNGVSNNLGVASVGTQLVTVNGNVYAPAVAQLNTPAVNFGVVRVGDVVAAQNVSVSNTTSGMLTDTLRASLSGGAAPFTASGTAAGVAAGATDASNLSVALNTGTAGVYSGTNAVVTYTSQNPEMADFALGTANVALSATVNNLAATTLAKTAGVGSLSGGALSYTLNFGTVVLGVDGGSTALSLTNSAFGPADALAGTFNLSALQTGDPFQLGGFNSFNNIAAGNSLAGGLSVGFSGTSLGSFDRLIVLNRLSTNSSLTEPERQLLAIELRLQGEVLAVPEPGTYGMMLTGLLVVVFGARRRTARQAA
ncbi:MAG: S-layer family protein [Propionivibrio sp.]|uniref:S-layer family protein n=1 Tax=Candidatus Propionivibrio dominans TaxID=2954373 RepID=A0A9D7F9N5_9RHOO|nr:S-layer family protein [Candidatus Propionivibrio dominans]